MTNPVRMSATAALAALLMLSLGGRLPAGAQEPAKAAKPAKAKKAPKEKAPGDSVKLKSAKFFQSNDLVTATLTTNIRQVKRDRPDKDGNAQWRAATLRFTSDSGPRTLPVRVRVRGIWRLKNCEMPPLRLNFSSDSTKHTIFHGLDKPKLVSVCRDNDMYEDYLLREFQLYRVYHVLTPASHAVRLLRLTYADSASGKTESTRYAFLEEEPNAVAERIGGHIAKIKGAMPDDLEPFQDALVGVFQYLIGNTDFNLAALHNAELLARDNGEYWPIVYDFDFSGAVNARYATVDPSIHVPTVRDRVYRGYCVPEDVYPKVFALFNEKKEAIYALYGDSLGKRLHGDDAKETLKYFDEFYKIINNPRDARSYIVESCIGAKKK